MPMRFPTLRAGRRPSGSTTSRTRRMTVESLESRELMAADFTSALGFGAPAMSAGAVAVDSSGNSVVAGFFSGSIALNPGSSTATLKAAGYHDIYLAEYSKSGSLLWAKDIPSSSYKSSQANAIALDGSGNILLTGTFSGTTNFNPGGSANLTSGPGGTDAFVAKYDSSGNYRWARSFSGSGVDQGSALTTDQQGNVVVVGSYTGTTAFGNTTLTGGQSAAFVTKLDPSGNVQWADGFNGNYSEYGSQVALDAAGNAYVGGAYQGTIRVGGQSLTAPYAVNASYVAKVSAAGSVQWADGFGGSANSTLGGLAVDSQGDVYAAGSFRNSLNFGGVGLSASGGYNNGYLAKISPTGAGLRAQAISGSGSIFVTGLGHDVVGNVYLAGMFQGTANFNPNSGTAASLTSLGGMDVFVQKLDAGGNYQWARQAGGSSNDFAGGIAVAGNDDVSVVGRYAGPAVFGPTLLQNISSTNSFIGHLSAPAAAASTLDFSSAVGIGGNAIDARSVSTDSAGNSYVTGFFNGTVNFATGGNVTTLTAAAYHDIYLAKYTNAGALVWAKDIPGTGFTQSQGNAVKVDASGHVFISGSFNGTVNFNPNGGGGSVTSAGYSDAFVAKYDGQGNFLWAKGFGGSGFDQSLSVTTDSAGNVYSTGVISDSVTVGGRSVSNSGSDAVIVKFDPSGSVVWARTFGNNSNAYGTHVAVDGSGNVYATGSYTANVSYTDALGANRTLQGNGSLPSVFATKLNPDGSIAWADGFTGSGNSTAGSLAVDASGHVFIDGTIRASTSFGGTTLTPNGGSSASGYVTKLNSDGSVAWAEQLGATTSSFAFDLATDSAGSVYVGGQFSGTTNFNPGSGGAQNLSSISGSQDVYVVKLDTNGSSIWAKTAGGAGTDTFRALAVAAPDDVTLVGTYTPTAFFHSIILPTKATSSNAFISRISLK